VFLIASLKGCLLIKIEILDKDSIEIKVQVQWLKVQKQSIWTCTRITINYMRGETGRKILRRVIRVKSNSKLLKI